MSYTKTHVVSFSPLLHSLGLATALAEAISRQLLLPPAAVHNLTAWKRRDIPSNFCPQDVVVFGAPVYGGRLPKTAVERFRNCSGNGAPALALVSYGNRAYEDALLELVELLHAKGFKVIGAAACIAQHTIAPACASGRPDQADLEELRKFGEAAAKILAQHSLDALSVPGVPGNHPFQAFTATPLPQTVSDACIDCQSCVEECPANAISAVDVSKVDTTKCICCMRCVQACPMRARIPNPNFIAKVEEKLAPFCATPKANEFFLCKIKA